MDPTEFVVVAGKIVGFGPAGARSAVSRAYYGAYHFGVCVLEEFQSAPPGNNKQHNLVPEFILTAGHPDGNRAARLLADLHGERIKADYRLENHSVETLEFAQSGVTTAEEIVRLLTLFVTACRSDSALQQSLKDGVQSVKRVRKI